MDYTIGKRERTNFLDERGRGTDGYRVWFRMSDGTIDYVQIEKAQFNSANVKAAIEAAIIEHQAVVGG